MYSAVEKNFPPGTVKCNDLTLINYILTNELLPLVSFLIAHLIKLHHFQSTKDTPADEGCKERERQRQGERERERDGKNKTAVEW